MKNCLLFSFLLLVVFIHKMDAQISNSGFEDWDANGNPVGWKAANVPPSYTTITKTSDAHSGNWAVEGSVVPFSIFTIAPSVISGEESQGIPVNFRPGSIKGFYKFISVQSDYLQVQANFKKNGTFLGVGANYLNPANTYTQFSIDIIFNGPEIPDSVLIAIFVGNATGFAHIGSKMFIDDLSWGTTTDVNDSDAQIPNEFKLEQNYPNPFNPSTKISWQVPFSSHQTLKVYDVLGKEVATLVDEEKPAGNYEIEFDAANLSSGMYLYRLQTGSFIETNKMIYLK